MGTPWEHPEGFGNLVHKVWNQSETSDDPALFAVKLDRSVWVPKHHHPTGALYVMIEGGMHFPGEGAIRQFQVRWTAPGHFYAGERSDADFSARITVLGTDLGPQFDDSPPPPGYLAEHRSNLHTVYRDPVMTSTREVVGRMIGSGSVGRSFNQIMV